MTKITKIIVRVNFIFHTEFYNAFNLHLFVNGSNFNMAEITPSTQTIVRRASVPGLAASVPRAEFG